jgi:bacillithiol biosynthesis deacetylase BshB1
MGELGTYGSEAIRKEELKKAAEILSLDTRVTLDIPDGKIRNNEENRLRIIEVIRKYRPEIIFSFMPHTRHPDHHHAGEMVKECLFLAGLEKIKTGSPPFRPSALFRFPELFIWNKPDFIVDITDFWEKRMEVLKAYQSQLNVDRVESKTPKTFLKSKELWELLEIKARMAGIMIGVKYGEPFYSERPLRILDPLMVAPKEFR